MHSVLNMCFDIPGVRPQTLPGLFLVAFLFGMSAFSGTASAGQDARTTENFCGGWRFHLGNAQNAEAPSFDDSGWRLLDLPHDWSIEGEFNKDNPAGVSGGALPGGIGWYRKSFALPESEKARLAFVEFDGVYRKSEVWINGHHLGNRPYGYSSFEYELSPWLRVR